LAKCKVAVYIYVSSLTILAQSFRGLNTSTFPDANQLSLKLVGGGENGVGVPIEQLLVKPRQLDVIVVMDATDGSDNNWPKYTSEVFFCVRH